MTNFDTPGPSGQPSEGRASDGAGQHHTRPLSGSPQEHPYAPPSGPQYPFTQQYPYGQYPYVADPYAADPYAQRAYPYTGAPQTRDPYAGRPYAAGPYGAYPAAYPLVPPPPAATAQVKRRRWLVGGAVGIVAAALVGVGIGTAAVGPASISGLGSSIQTPSGTGGNSGTGSNSGGSNSGSSGSSGSTGSTGPGQTSVTAGTASATQQIGIVTVVSVLKYQPAESAGTGMILTSSGEILTNNHVINGATSITVTVETTGRSYRADVVGTSPTQDVAVLQLRDASGLQTAKLASSSAGTQVGDKVIGVGNARGTGTLTAASGKVTALDQSITASSETGADAERLHGLIETNAPIVAGDSGGPLYNAAGKIIGIDTAASAQSQRTTAAAQAYAIPIENATAVADKIEAGDASSTIHIGLPGFIGIETAVSPTGGVGVSGVLEGGPAEKAGITGGSVITAVNGKSIADAAQLKSVLSADKPGDRVSITWTDANAQSHTATLTLIAGPAD